MQKALIQTKANALFSRISFVKTSVADIAKACGLGKGTIYLYFKSKDEIVHAIIEERIARIVEADAAFFGDPALPLEAKVSHFFEGAVDESFALKELIFGAFENVQGRMFTDVFLKYGRYFEWGVDRFANLVRAYPPYADRPADELREDARTLIELVVGRMVLFLMARDWNDKEGLKAIVGPLSLRLFRSIIG